MYVLFVKQKEINIYFILFGFPVQLLWRYQGCFGGGGGDYFFLFGFMNYISLPSPAF